VKRARRGPLTSITNQPCATQRQIFWPLQLRLTTLPNALTSPGLPRSDTARDVTRGGVFRAPGWRGQDETRSGSCSGAQGQGLFYCFVKKKKKQQRRSEEGIRA